MFLVRSHSINVVVSRIGQVVGMAYFLQPRVFHTAAFFIGRLWNHDRLRPTIEMNTVVTLGVPERRSTVMVLRPVKHDVLSVLLYDARVKCSCGFERLAPGRHNRAGRKPRPLSKTWSRWNVGQSGESNENRQSKDRSSRRAGYKIGYFDHSRNFSPYQRTGHRGKLLKNVFIVVTGKRFTGQNSASNRKKDRPGTCSVPLVVFPFTVIRTVLCCAAGIAIVADGVTGVGLYKIKFSFCDGNSFAWHA